MLIVKIHPRMKCLHNFFSFFSTRHEISTLSFWQEWIHPGMKFHPGENVQTVRAAWSVFFFIMVVLFHFFFLFYIKFSPEIKEIQCCYFNFQLVNYILLLDSQVGRSWPWDWVKKKQNNQTDQNYLWLESSLIRILLRVICSIRDRPQSSRLILDKFKQLTSINIYPHEIIRNPSVFWWFQGE